ncbi:phage tail tape measure protein [Escherichia coli]
MCQLTGTDGHSISGAFDVSIRISNNAMSKGADIIDVMQRLGGVADRLDYRKAAALGSTFLTLGAAPEVAASAANAMVRELSIATMQSKSFFEGMNLLKLNPEVIEKQMTKDAMGTIQRVLEKVNALPQDKRLSAMTMLFGKEFGDDAAKLANNLPELQRQLKLTAGNDALGSMQKESDINKDSLSAQWLLVKTGAQNTFSSLGETLRQPLMDKVMMPSGGFPSWGYGFAGMYDSGGYIPRGQFGIVGENGPEIVNGPANVTSRRNTAALAAVVAGMMGVAAAPAELPPLHPLALPAKGGEAIVSRAATVPPVYRIEAPTQIIIQTQPGQSAQDIAREVARQLDERERRLKAKARSNYSDQGGYDA